MAAAPDYRCARSVTVSDKELVGGACSILLYQRR